MQVRHRPGALGTEGKLNAQGKSEAQFRRWLLRGENVRRYMNISQRETIAMVT